VELAEVIDSLDKVPGVRVLPGERTESVRIEASQQGLREVTRRIAASCHIERLIPHRPQGSAGRSGLASLARHS
jgi:hypothetical protein